MTEHTKEATRNRAVLVGLNAHSLSREDNASETSLEELARPGGDRRGNVCGFPPAKPGCTGGPYLHRGGKGGRGDPAGPGPGG